MICKLHFLFVSICNNQCTRGVSGWGTTVEADIDHKMILRKFPILEGRVTFSGEIFYRPSQFLVPPGTIIGAIHSVRSNGRRSLVPRGTWVPGGIPPTPFACMRGTSWRAELDFRIIDSFRRDGLSPRHRQSRSSRSPSFLDGGGAAKLAGLRLPRYNQPSPPCPIPTCPSCSRSKSGRADCREPI